MYKITKSDAMVSDRGKEARRTLMHQRLQCGGAICIDQAENSLVTIGRRFGRVQMSAVANDRT